jgi:hypothetical protein
MHHASHVQRGIRRLSGPACPQQRAAVPRTSSTPGAGPSCPRANQARTPPAGRNSARDWERAAEAATPVLGRLRPMAGNRTEAVGRAISDTGRAGPRPVPETGASPPSHRPARIRPVPTAVSSEPPPREDRDTARASRASRCAAASARSSRPRSSSRSPGMSTPTSPPRHRPQTNWYGILGCQCRIALYWLQYPGQSKGIP